MTYYPDLSPFEYGSREPGTVNIGWLDSRHEFPTGVVPEGFVQRLELFYAHAVNHYLGFHTCPWCGYNGLNADNRLGNGELRIVGPERVYATPTLILHYITAHGYLPPQEFIEAVLHGPLPGTHDWTLARARFLWREPEAVYKVVKEQRDRYPTMTVQDAYKLLYQGVLGADHLCTDAETFMQRLHEEIETLAPVAYVEESWEHIHPGRAMIRINLRPHVSNGRSTELLAEWCLSTAVRSWGTPDVLRAAWGAFVALCETGQLAAFPPKAVQSFAQWLEEHDYPAVPHSDAYCEAYRPAYRVIAAAALEESLS